MVMVYKSFMCIVVKNKKEIIMRQQNNPDAERIEYTNSNFEALNKAYPKGFSLQDDLDLLSDGTDETAKEEAKVRMDKAFNKIENPKVKRAKKEKPETTGIHKTGSDFKSIGKNTKDIAKGLIQTGILSGKLLTSTAKIAFNTANIGVRGLNIARKSIGMTATGAVVASTLVAGAYFGVDYIKDQNATSITQSFNDACTNQSANIQLFCQTAMAGAEVGVSPVALFMTMAAETGFYDVDGMRNSNGADFYQGAFQTGPANLIDLVRHHATSTPFYINANDSNPQKIAIDAFLNDKRIKSQSGREALVKDLIDGRNDQVYRTFLNLRNDHAIIGQLMGLDLTSKHPELLLTNLSGDINEHYKQVVEVAGNIYLSHLAGEKGSFYVEAIAKIHPNLTFAETSEVQVTANLIKDEENYSYRASASGLLRMALNNSTTVFRDGADTKFGDVAAYTQQFIVDRGATHYKQLLIAMGADEDIFVLPDGQIVTTTAPLTSKRPKARPDQTVSSAPSNPSSG